MPAINFMKRYAPAIEAGTKTQTIRKPRKDGRAHCKVGDTVALYTGMRTTGCRKLMDVECLAVLPISIHPWVLKVDDGWLRSGENMAEMDKFARSDGFKDWVALTDFFEETHGFPFEGTLIKWRQISPKESTGETS